MISIVYVLGTASPCNNLELKYSLASIRKYCESKYRVFIIGDHPGFEGDFIHIPDTDRGRNKQHNIMLKIQTACNIPDISNPFLFVNDDFVFIRPFTPLQIPEYYNTNLTRMWKSKRKVGHYKTALFNTLIALSEKDLPIRHYDIHTPTLYKKDDFLFAMSLYNWKEMHGFVIKSLYWNTIGTNGVSHPDPKVVPAFSDIADLENEIKDWFMFSYDDISFNDTMKEFLAMKFPEVTPLLSF